MRTGWGRACARRHNPRRDKQRNASLPSPPSAQFTSSTPSVESMNPQAVDQAQRVHASTWSCSSAFVCSTPSPKHRHCTANTLTMLICSTQTCTVHLKAQVQPPQSSCACLRTPTRHISQLQAAHKPGATRHVHNTATMRSTQHRLTDSQAKPQRPLHHQRLPSGALAAHPGDACSVPPWRQPHNGSQHAQLRRSAHT
jgi:hypothetical protein